MKPIIGLKQLIREFRETKTCRLKSFFNGLANHCRHPKISSKRTDKIDYILILIPFAVPTNTKKYSINSMVSQNKSRVCLHIFFEFVIPSSGFPEVFFVIFKNPFNTLFDTFGIFCDQIFFY